MKEALPKGFYFRSSDHSYFMDGERMTGVTSVLSVISKPMLVPWAARMACEYTWSAAVDKSHESIRDDKTGLKISLDDLEAILLEAKNAHTKKKEAGGAAGTDVHSEIEIFVRNCIKSNNGVPDINIPVLKVAQPFVAWAIGEKIRFISSEEKLYSKQMFVAGTCDAIIEKEGKTYILDIKTYKKLWDRVPMLQAAGYGLMYREMKQKDVAGYVIFNLPKKRDFDETQDVKWSYDVAGDQEGFMAALSLYRILANW